MKTFIALTDKTMKLTFSALLLLMSLNAYSYETSSNDSRFPPKSSTVFVNKLQAQPNNQTNNPKSNELKPDGAECTSFDECQAGWCATDTHCQTRGCKGICGTKLPVGSTCQYDNECFSSYCQGNIGGLGGGMAHVLGTCVQDKSPDGSKCALDEHCQSGYCQGNKGGGEGVIGTCTPYKSPDGSKCALNEHCESGYCQGNGGGGLGAIGTCTAYQSPDGSKCALNEHCQSGYCKGNGGGGEGAIGTCTANTSPNGAACYLDSHCQSDYCLANSSGMREGQCGNRYNNPSGYQCTLDSQCASGDCKGNGIFGGLPGVCR